MLRTLRQSLSNPLRRKAFLMNKQDSRENQLPSPNKLVRVVRIELSMSKTNILKFVPSSFLEEVTSLLKQADELELRFKIEDKSKSKTRQL
jgi:hypothetical protein